ncbi:branched-chain amino acid ABC transporter permease [Desulfatitalea alkaliphila]|uniref:Branched-chain amino acid ABC transporter permease n=1 Tax=Desulfatitalea alkaliphila TaxID=2929485 RepID=A0AA41R7H7_9BACT|nr:branched-chain amino acid ABC transporter permease [Desulfatitalea alkaliphila]MCJ8502942.1 branched-chain amino acid ABC transporter permease [Desulfatitalea alkaliphila]
MLRIHKPPMAVGAVAIAVLPLIMGRVPALEHYPLLMVFAGIYCLLTIGLSLLMGYAGQISLGHAAFYGIGAYTSGVLTVHFGLNPWLCILAGALLAALVALAIGTPALKLQGHYLAMATLAFGIIVNIVFREEVRWTGGPDGLIGIPMLSLFGFHFDAIVKYYYLVWAVVAGAFVFSANLLQSPVGRALRAIHTSEAAAGAMGIPIARYKVTVFVIAAVMAALGGSLYAHFMNFINPGTFDLFFSIQLILMIALGGMHSIWGAMVGAILIAFLSFEWLHHFGEWEIVVYGLVLLVVTIFFPKGLAGLPKMVTERIRR